MDTVQNAEPRTYIPSPYDEIIQRFVLTFARTVDRTWDIN
jgi:hypothetical protein